MISQTFEVFWPRALLQCTAAGDLNAVSRTAHTPDFRAPDTTQVGHRSHKASQLPQQKASSPSNSSSSPSCSIQIPEFKPPLNSWARLTSTHQLPPPLFVKLEQEHIRSMDFRGGKRVSTRASESPIPGFHSGPTLLEQDELCIDHGRSGEVDQETGHCTSRSSSRPVSEPRIHSSQEGRLSPSGGESETSGSFCPKTPFKMEGAGNDWLVSIDLKDAYLSIQIAEKDRKFLPFLWKEQT